MSKLRKPKTRLPPHSFDLFGEKWRVRYGDASGDVFDASKEWGVCYPIEHTIYLDPSLRLLKNRELVWRVFAHEVLHALDETMVRRRQRRRGWRSPSHAFIERLSVPLGSFLSSVLNSR